MKPPGPPEELSQLHCTHLLQLKICTLQAFMQSPESVVLAQNLNAVLLTPRTSKLKTCPNPTAVGLGGTRRSRWSPQGIAMRVAERAGCLSCGDAARHQVCSPGLTHRIVRGLLRLVLSQGSRCFVTEAQEDVAHVRVGNGAKGYPLWVRGGGEMDGIQVLR